MAGGSLFKSKDARADPSEIFNLRLLFLLCTIAWAGMFYGFDQVSVFHSKMVQPTTNAYPRATSGKSSLSWPFLPC